MENAVTAIALDAQTLVTTSTGVKDAANGVSGYAVRIFKEGKQVAIQRSHYASVRCSAPFFLQNHLPSAVALADRADGFLTGGNDGKVIGYRSDGAIVFRGETPPNVESWKRVEDRGRGSIRS